MFNFKSKKSFERRKNRVRFRILSSKKKHPRLSVYRTNKNIYVQLIDDLNGSTLAFASTIEKSFKEKFPLGSNIKAAEEIGKIIAGRTIRLGIKKIVFDRSGYLYHGRVKALADSARKNSLIF